MSDNNPIQAILDRLRDVGYTPGQRHHLDGRECLVGAIESVLGYQANDLNIDPYEWSSKTPEGEFLIDLIQEQYPQYADYYWISALLSEFNDYQGWEALEALLEKGSIRWDEEHL